MPDEDYIEGPKLEDDRDVDIKLEPGSSSDEECEVENDNNMITVFNHMDSFKQESENEPGSNSSINNVKKEIKRQDSDGEQEEKFKSGVSISTAKKKQGSKYFHKMIS